jgi:two-component system, NarL family, nitrate/nitrite response regulator NarL
MTSRTTIFLADDHPLFLEGLVRALEGRPELALVGTATDGRTALEAILASPPDVAVLDVKMSGLDGVQVANALTRKRVRTRVILVSAYAEDDLVYRALAAGARAYLTKETSRTGIFDAVSGVMAGEVVVSPTLQKLVAREIRRRETAERPLLTPREQDVLALIAEGRRAPEVAEELHLSATTIKSHMQSIYEKLGVGDRAAAVAAAMRRGLLE